MGADGLLPVLERLEESVRQSKRGRRFELRRSIVEEWHLLVTAILPAVQRIGSELSAEHPQAEVCAACLLVFVKRDFECFREAVEAFLRGSKKGVDFPSTRARARLREETGRLYYKLLSLLEMPCLDS